MENQEVEKMVPPVNALNGIVKKFIGFMRAELIFRGILFLILGLLMMCRPGETMLVITITIGVFTLVDGVIMLISALMYHGSGKGMAILNSILLILLGLFCCTAPLKMNIVWVIMVGFWQLFSGISCLSLRASAGNSAIFSGICGIIAGLILIFMPVLGLLTLMWLMGIFAFIGGLSALILGIRLRKALK